MLYRDTKQRMFFFQVKKFYLKVFKILNKIFLKSDFININ